jgi:hypothetical protein
MPQRVRKLNSPAHSHAVYRGPTPAALACIPDALKARMQWVLFQLLEAPNASGELKLNKLPINPRTLANGSTTNPKTWCSYTTCVEALPEALAAWARTPPTTYNTKPATYVGLGVGYVFTADDPYMLVDLDHSVDPDTGTIADWAQAIIETLGSYTQYSVSGTGVHILLQAQVPTPDMQHGDVQMWHAKRFCAMTGRPVRGTPPTIEPRQHQLTIVHAAHILLPKAAAQAKKAATQAPHTPARGAPTQAAPTAGPPLLSDQEILHLASRAKNSAKFVRLWSGDIAGYGSHSEADEALVSLLAFYTRDERQLASLFRQSALCDPKWETRQDYRDTTIARALALVTEHYDPVTYAVTHAGRCDRARVDVAQQHPPGGPTEGTRALVVALRLLRDAVRHFQGAGVQDLMRQMGAGDPPLRLWFVHQLRRYRLDEALIWRIVGLAEAPTVGGISTVTTPPHPGGAPWQVL